MRKANVSGRVLLAIVVALVLWSIAFKIRQQVNETENVSIGQIADKNFDHSPRFIRITNCAGGTLIVEHLVFPSPVSNRFAVVFRIRDPATYSPDCLEYRGMCFGVITVPVAEIPCLPPFVYVDHVSPSP